MIYLIILSMLIFQGTLIEIFPIFKNLDEIITVILFLLLFIKVFIQKQNVVLYKYEVFSLVSLIIFFIIGNISMWKSSIHVEYLFSATSGILTVKSILIYFFTRICLNNYNFNKNLLYKYDKFLGLILWIYFIIAIVDLKLNFLEGVSFRYGIKNIAMGFTHAATFEYFIISIMVIRIFIKIKLNRPMKEHYIIIMQSSILVVLAGRTKGVVFIALFIVLYFIVRFYKKFKLRYMILMSPIVIYLSYDKIIHSFFSKDEARGVLYRTSVKIANDYFPLGSGFSTFGSDFSRKMYSEIYYKYHINNIWGLSREKASFITDTQWASILGECGYLGMLMYFISIISILILLINISKNGMIKLSISSLLIYGLVSSISDSILVSFRGAGIFFIIACFISIEKSSNQYKYK